MPTLLNLANDLDALLKSLSSVSNDRKIGDAYDMLTDLVNTTPCDRGIHISNWRIGVGRPVDGPVPAHVPGKGGSTRAANIRAALAVARVALASVRPGQPVFISNAGPAILQLNGGSSAQAPAGFIERAILKSRIARRVRITN